MSQDNQQVPTRPTASSTRGEAGPTVSAPLRAGNVGGAAWLPWVVLAALWGPLFWRLIAVWSASVDYSYGWAVPVLAVYLFLERWNTRPAARPATNRVETRFATMAMLIGLAVIMATTPVFAANRWWPALQWLAAGGVVLASVGVLAGLGGWRWSTHFYFPLGFATTALVWPAMVQVPLMHGLAHLNAWIAADVASLSGYPAVVHGNIIEVGTGFVGVDEACSGLRSLQGVWMLGWFFGELMRFSWRRRLGLVLLALGIAFAGNLARTIFLTLKIATEGAAAGDRWHDLAGNAVLVGTLGLVAVVAYAMARRSGPTFPAVVGVGVPNVSRRGAALVLALVLITEAGTVAWYSWRTAQATRVEWALTPPSNEWSELAVPERSVEILRCSSAEGRAWRSAGDTQQALAFVFRWEGDSVVGEEAIYHDPSACLPLIGTTLEARLAPTVAVVDGVRLEFATYRFSAQGKPQHVFFCLWDAFLGEPLRETSAGGQFTRYRLQRVREGRLRADLAHVTFVLQGEFDDARAREWLTATAGRLLQRR